MKFLKAIKNGHPSADDPSLQPGQGENQTMVDRFAKLGEHDAVTELGQLNQSELTAVESYERANRDRPAVHNKLRYLRQPEPLAGYDSLDTPDVVAALDGVDMTTLKTVREYERKMQNRATVLNEVTRALHQSTMPDA
ncbi:MAG: hypothetical protein QOG41_1039, partial [Thermoleophilaceae bacterium]|nr:hypothetical protein [Thermoleophilaceae bacterium]